MNDNQDIINIYENGVLNNDNIDTSHIVALPNDRVKCTICNRHSNSPSNCSFNMILVSWEIFAREHVNCKES